MSGEFVHPLRATSPAETAYAVRGLEAAEHPDALAEFIPIHNAYMVAWNRAIQSGDSSEVERALASDYRAVVRGSDGCNTELRGAAEGVAWLRSTLSEAAGSVHFSSGRTLCMCAENEILVTYERNIMGRGAPLARFVVVQTWRCETGGWRIVYELVERAGARK
jgi:hypothetical protein